MGRACTLLGRHSPTGRLPMEYTNWPNLEQGVVVASASDVCRPSNASCAIIVREHQLG
jgi:hypothetical protein